MSLSVARPEILLVEDTPSLSQIYQRYLSDEGYPVTCAMTAAEALGHQARKPFPIMLLDLMLPDGDGLDVLRKVRVTQQDVKAIVVTSNGSINHAVSAMRVGAFDFLVKPFDKGKLLRAVEAAAALDRQPPSEPGGFEGFIGGSPAMTRIYGVLEGVARSTASVFITGESGTGKEVCAEAIHALSPRRDGPFVPLNCGAIPRDLLESEVFGHLKGSFTGAIADKIGAAAAAHGGTLFLDEICEMDFDLQAKLLRFLQTSMIQPVGAPTPRPVDVRIVCATNRDPQEEVARGRFRTDLFYRLHVVPIHMPPLRDRGDDIILIAETLLQRYAGQEGRRFRGLSDTVAKLFRSYDWPGNVRELQNVIRNVVVLHDADLVEPEMLPDRLTGALGRAPARDAAPIAGADEDMPLRARLGPFVGHTLQVMEREFIEATIAAHGDSIPRAARSLDVSPSTLYRKRAAWEKT